MLNRPVRKMTAVLRSGTAIAKIGEYMLTAHGRNNGYRRDGLAFIEHCKDYVYSKIGIRRILCY